MNLKKLMGLIAAGCLIGSVAFGQTLQLTGTVTALTSSQITLQSGNDTWTIIRHSTTKVTSGHLNVGSAVTLQCATPDAHKNEAIKPPPAASG